MIFCTFLNKNLEKVDEIYGCIIGVARGGDFGVTYLHPILNLPRPPAPVRRKRGTRVDTCKVNRLGRYYTGHLQS